MYPRDAFHASTVLTESFRPLRASLIDPSPTTCNVLVNLGNSLDWFHMFPLAGTSLVPIVKSPSVDQTIAVFSAMRAYAITTNRILTVVVFVLSLAPVALNFVRLALHRLGTPGTVTLFSHLDIDRQRTRTDRPGYPARYRDVSLC